MSSIKLSYDTAQLLTQASSNVEEISEVLRLHKYSFDDLLYLAEALEDIADVIRKIHSIESIRRIRSTY